MIALFDHEEVGSESHERRRGPLLETVLERLAGGRRRSASTTRYRALAALELRVGRQRPRRAPQLRRAPRPGHAPLVNHGPAIKINANQRYATVGRHRRAVRAGLRRGGVPCQVFVSRNNMPCGSTIGPLTATRLGIATVDVGIPQLSMHSARELCGVDDPRAGWRAALTTPTSPAERHDPGLRRLVEQLLQLACSSA